ncbi:MAG: hypothetical protein AAFQ86_03255 [Bacteroidota bacterium]
MTVCLFRRMLLHRLHATWLSVLLGLFALSLLVGCDTASDDEPPPETLVEDVALSVANALALHTNGALDVVADLALARVEAISPASAPLMYSASGVTRTYRYDGPAVTWRVTADGRRGSRDADFFADIRRTYTLNFLTSDGRLISSFDAPNDRATSLQVAVTSGTSDRDLPGSSSRLTNMQGSLTVTDLDAAALTVNGTLTLSGLDRIARDDNVFAGTNFTLVLTIEDVRGPSDGRDGWAGEATGRITGAYRATYSREVGGVVTDQQTVERTVEIDLESGAGLQALRLLFDTQVFRANIETGQLTTLAP